MSMLSRYPEIEKQYEEIVTTIVLYSGGGITYEEAWTLSSSQRKEFHNGIKDKMELIKKLASLGGMGGLI